MTVGTAFFGYYSFFFAAVQHYIYIYIFQPSYDIKSIWKRIDYRYLHAEPNKNPFGDF